MIKRKYALSIFFFAVSFVVPGCAFGAVVITEVMYNPLGSDSGREWVELYNGGSESVELTPGQKGWKVHDGSNHLLATGVIVPPGEFVVVANNPTIFAAQYGNIAAVKSAISLNNSGRTISIMDAQGALVDSVSYNKDFGAFEDGMSLHRVGTSFAPGVPNPGAPPMPEVPKKAPVPAKAIAPQKLPTQKTTESSKSTEPEVSNTATSSIAAVGSMPAQDGFLWHYILGLAALILFGMASVWYLRGQETQPETVSSVEEFDIE